MNRTWLVLDCNNLCHRAFHTTGDLENGTLFGFLRDLTLLQEQHATTYTVFTFDHGKSLREIHHPHYKQARREKAKDRPPEIRQKYARLREEIDLLKTSLLHEIGFRNVFYADGYEADDIIASVCETVKQKGDDAVIVSSDHDLYQLLCPWDKVILWNPVKKKAYTHKSLVEEFGVGADSWHFVKAIAGCSSDGVKGVQGVAEKTAAKYVSCTMKEGSAAYERIIGAVDLWKANKVLVKLPYEGTPTFTLKKDKVTEKRWRDVKDRYGFRTLLSGRYAR